MQSKIQFTLQTLFLIILALIFSGCDSRTVNPLQESPEEYSIYGALEIGNQENLIRIRKVDTVLLADSSEFNGLVTLTALDTGVESVLRDTVINYDGHFTHNFKVDIPVEYDSNYMIRVEREDGGFSEATASTPKKTSVSVSPNPLESNIGCITPVLIRFGNVSESEFIRMNIGFNFDGMKWARLNLMAQFLERDIETNEQFIRLSPKEMLIEVFPPPLPDIPFSELDPRRLGSEVSCFDLEDTTVYIEYFHFGDEWLHALPFEIGNLDIQSGLIKNGIGFFGGYNIDRFSIPFTVR